MTTRRVAEQLERDELVEVGHFVKHALATWWALSTTGRAKVVKPGHSVEIPCYGKCLAADGPDDFDYDPDFKHKYSKKSVTITEEQIDIKCLDERCGGGIRGYIWPSKRRNESLRQELRTNFGFVLNRPITKQRYNRKSINEENLKCVPEKNEQLIRVHDREISRPEFNEATLVSTARATGRCAECGGERTHYVAPLHGSVGIVCGTCDDERTVVKFNSKVLYGLEPHVFRWPERSECSESESDSSASETSIGTD